MQDRQCAGVFVSSWLGGLLLQVGEWLIKKLPLVKHIYSAAKQVSAAVNPSNESTASFRECVIVRHPRQGELAFGFITGQTTLAVRSFSTHVELDQLESPDPHWSVLEAAHDKAASKLLFKMCIASLLPSSIKVDPGLIGADVMAICAAR